MKSKTGCMDIFKFRTTSFYQGLRKTGLAFQLAELNIKTVWYI